MPYKIMVKEVPSENNGAYKTNSLGRLFLFLRRRRIITLALLLIITGAGYGLYAKYFHLTPAEIAQKELVSAVAAVSKHMMLPDGDQPVLATVTDAKTLMSQQAFFTGAVNGDQLLLFPRSLKAVLYSPSRNLIVNTGPIQNQPTTINQQLTTDNQPSIVSQQPTAHDSPLTVEIRNGTGKTGYGATIAKQISANGNYSIIQVADAAAKNYAKTLVVDRAAPPDKKALTLSLAEAFGAEVASAFPSGEKSTQADILVILGEK